MAWCCTGDKPLPKPIMTWLIRVCKHHQVLTVKSEDPPTPHDYPYYWFIFDPKSKQDQVKVTRICQNFNFFNLKRPLHVIHLLKLLDKMCKYEKDPASIVADTERTRLCPQTDRQGETSILPSTSLSRGYNYDPINKDMQASPGLNELIPLMLEMEYSGFVGEYHACWCSGS